MKTYLTKTLCLLTVLSGISYSAIKGPNYDDIRSMGMGNTTVAVTTDRTAIFHNPAGLSLLKDKIDISISPLTLSIDGKLITILKAIIEQGDKLSDINNIDDEFIDTLNQIDGNWVGVEYIPEITVAAKNIGFGMYSVWPLGTKIETGHFIPKLGLRGERDLVFTWAVGIPIKHKKTFCGISVEYLQRTPLSDTIMKYTDTFIYFDEIIDKPLGVVNDFSQVQHGVSFDVGFMHNFKGFRLAYDVKDLLGIIGGEFVAPPQIDLGAAYFFPQMEKVNWIENLILSLEFSDIFGIEPVTEKYEQPWKKFHAGFEWDVKYAALRLGINQGYPTVGVGIRLGVFCADYVFFSEELGYYAGQFPKKKHVLSLGVNFKVKRPPRENEARDTASETPDEDTKTIKEVQESVEDKEPPIKEEEKVIEKPEENIEIDEEKSEEEDTEEAKEDEDESLEKSDEEIDESSEDSDDTEDETEEDETDDW